MDYVEVKMGDINQNGIIERIRESLGNPCECIIRKDGCSYIIEPKYDNGKVSIRQLTNHSIFSYNLTFKKCIFKCELRFTIKTSSTIKFERCIFKKFVNFNGSTFNKVFFEDAIFENISYFIKIRVKQASFLRSRFKERAFFSESTFKNKANFAEVIFDHNAHFDGAKFQRGADFSLSEFYVNAHFYQTKFKNDGEDSEKEELDFKQTIFNGYINLTDTKIFDFNFEQLKPEIQTSGDAKGFRNIFKNIKNALIKDNNLIDASHFHKMELYAKELELEYKRKEEMKGSKCSSMLKIILSNGKNFIDEIQLMFYRLTSDHHTNLLMILNNVIFLIALFGIAKCAIENKYVNISETLVSVIFVIISILFLLRPKFTLEESCCKCSKIIKSNFAVILFYYIPAVLAGYILFNYYASSCLLCIASVIFILYSLLMEKRALLCDITKEKIILPFMYLMPKARTCIVIAAYGIVACMIFKTPSSILPILGKLIENKSGEICLFVVGNVKLLCCGGNSFASQTLNLIYMLFLFLLLWSLQKTARKNTIVPS